MIVPPSLMKYTRLWEWLASTSEKSFSNWHQSEADLAFLILTSSSTLLDPLSANKLLPAPFLPLL